MLNENIRCNESCDEFCDYISELHTVIRDLSDTIRNQQHEIDNLRLRLNSELTDSSKWAIKSFCQHRFDKYSNPCERCPYRQSKLVIPEDGNIYCLFGNCPSSWGSY